MDNMWRRSCSLKPIHIEGPRLIEPVDGAGAFYVMTRRVKLLNGDIVMGVFHRFGGVLGDNQL